MQIFRKPSTKRLFLFRKVYSLIGEGNGTPLQYSCLENPMDGGAWWAAVYRVAQSRIQLKRLSSSSSMNGQFSVSHQQVPLSGMYLKSIKTQIGESIFWILFVLQGCWELTEASVPK